MRTDIKIKIIIIILTATTFSILVYSVMDFQINPSEKNEHIDSAQIHVAKNFDTYYDGENRILVDGAQRRLILSEQTVQDNENSILIPAKRIVVFSSTHAAYMSRLGVADKIVGVTGGNTEWYIAPIKKGLQNKTIRDLGIDNSPDYDQLVALDPDLVVLVGGTGMWEKHGKKLDDLSIPYVVCSEWLEDDPLGKFEWIKFFGVLSGVESKAGVIFDDAKVATEALFESVKTDKSSKVVWASIFNGIVYVPRSSSYVGETLKKANSEYVFDDISGTGSTQVGMEEFVLRAKNADVFVFSGDFVNSTEQIRTMHPMMSELGPVRKCNVYSFQPWYWQSTDRYEEYVSDIIAIVHSDVFDGYQLRQFKKLECA